MDKIEEAKALIKQQNEQDIQNCIKELNEAEAAILQKYGCVKGIVGQFVNDKISYQITINKA